MEADGAIWAAEDAAGLTTLWPGGAGRRSADMWWRARKEARMPGRPEHDFCAAAGAVDVSSQYASSTTYLWICPGTVWPFTIVYPQHARHAASAATTCAGG